MRSVSARSLALVLAQFGLEMRKDFLLHTRRNGDRDPILRLALDVTRTPSERLQGRSPLTSCDLARPIGIRCADRGWIRENVADAGCGPALLASSGRDARSAQAQRNLVEGGLRLKVPGKDLLNDHTGDRIRSHSCRVTRVLRIDLLAVGRARPRQQLTSAQLGQSSAPHAVSDQDAFVFGHRAADL
jgi:hypothetical protein